MKITKNLKIFRKISVHEGGTWKPMKSWAAVRIAPFERNHVRFAPDQKQRKLVQEATLEEQRVLFDVTCFDVC